MGLDEKGFNLWADGYDNDVNVCDDKNKYPFAGYKNILNYIYNIIRSKPHSNILDIGIGTGILTSKLYEFQYEITGIDFSDKMLEIAKQKMPNAKLINWDFSKGLSEEVKYEKFDFIVSTYALHHLKDEMKIHFLEEISTILKDDGIILIGDISFETRDELTTCKDDCGVYWDNDEYYFVANEIILNLQNVYTCNYIKMSHCAGILILKVNDL